MKNIIIITAFAAALSSCGIYSKYRPVQTVPEDLYGAQAQVNADSVSLGNICWREIFTDPYLQALIEKGLENNTDYLSAQLRIDEARATLLSSKLAFLPSFALSPQGTVSSPEGQETSWSYQIPVTASWELDIFGRMRNAKKQAQALYAQSRDYRQAVRTQLIADIANTYYTLLMLDEQLSISQQTARSWQETVSTARALMQAGQYDEAGVAQMEATCCSVQTSVLDLEEQINQTENSLALLLAETPRHYERGRLDGQELPEEFSVGIPLQILSCRPDVRSAEHNLEAAFYAVGQARANFYPSIALNGSAGWTNDIGAAIMNPAGLLSSVIGSLTQPIFNRGQNIANLRIAKAKLEEASLDFQQTLLNAGVEVNNALTAYQTANAKTLLYEKQVEALREALRSTALLMEHGPRNYLEVLTARQALLNAELTQVANRFTGMQNIVNLYQALGGGREE